MSKTRKAPERMCVGCKTMKNKKELIRVVRSPEGNYDVDATGKKNGRGAYLCPCQECFEAAVKNKGFERSFKEKIAPEVVERLRTGLVK